MTLVKLENGTIVNLDNVTSIVIWGPKNYTMNFGSGQFQEISKKEFDLIEQFYLTRDLGKET